jgi:glycogen debranching enzyme
LLRRGVHVSDDIVDCAGRGLRFLLDTRQRDRDTGLVTIVHPWESGADDSPRWDHWDVEGSWYETTGSLLATVTRSESGSPIANPAFGAAPVAFNALLAFNAEELADASDDADLRRHAHELADAIAERWDDELSTWIDGGPSAASSGRIRTLDALLPTLCRSERISTATTKALALAVDDAAYGGACGPAGVHRSEPTFESRAYWRGSSWPQLTYLLWLAARRHGSRDLATELARRAIAGAQASQFAEHWDPDDGTPLGACPQSWTALVAVMAGEEPSELSARPT